MTPTDRRSSSNSVQRGTPEQAPTGDDPSFTRAGMWLMMAGCCLSLPLAIAVTALTGVSLVDSRPALLVLVALLVTCLAVAALTRHRADLRHSPRC